MHRLDFCSNKSRKTGRCCRVIENSFFICLGVWITRIGVNKESIQLDNTICRGICFGIGENDCLGRKGNIMRGAIDPETYLNRLLLGPCDLGGLSSNLLVTRMQTVTPNSLLLTY